MRIVVLVPSRDYVNNAGARIRYRRLSSGPDADVQISLEDIAQFDPRSAPGDVLIISKCHDARSLLAAIICSRRGMRVGVDLFDDYFSQRADSRLNRFRQWLSQLLPLCDFAMCSTALMAKIIDDYRAGLPTFVLNDPAPPVDYASLSEILTEKLSDARAEGRLRFAWFGVGDNPNFAVGLSDLAAFADVLSCLGEEGRAVELTVLTNARALDARRLAMLSNLPVRTVVQEWSEAAEAELLRNSFACFLPVNAQQFSAAKSLNRAVTALSAGCQIISAGYPLYAALDEFIYRDPTDFVADLARVEMRLGPATIERFRAAIDDVASPLRETEALRSFLLGLAGETNRRNSTGLLHLVHGYATNGAAHKMVQSVGGLSVGSPFCPAPLDFDIIFQMRPGREVAMLVSDKALSCMRPELRARAAVFGPIRSRNFWEVQQDGAIGGAPGKAWHEPSLSLQLALYPSVMKAIGKALQTYFGTGPTIISENSTLPFEVVH